MATTETEQFSRNAAIDADIHEILASFQEPSRSRMRKRIIQDRDALQKYGTHQTDENARHSFREFLVARRLNELGFALEYNRRLEGKTPDWYDEQNRLIVEVFTCERGGTSAPSQRIAANIVNKVTKYRQIVQDKSLAFIVAVHGDFISGLDLEDFEDAIRDAQLFEKYTDLTGVIFFAESGIMRVKQVDGSTMLKQQYRYSYFANPSPARHVEVGMT